MMRAWIVVALFFAATAAQAARYAGRPLVDALRDLESRGLHLIYSSEVIQPELVVRVEPDASTPRAVLDLLLREHSLHAVDGPKGTLVIVRDSGSSPAHRDAEPVSAALPMTVDQIVVTPSHFGILGKQPEQRQFLSREDVQTIPHFSDDIYRAINRIPGAATNDVSANFNIRGGASDEVEVLLDGVQIYEPFHLKDLFSAFSTLDAETMGSVDILTGGFPAEYGGRMSGVIDISSLTPAERRTELGISMLNSRALSAGTFGGGKGQWLFSFRPGYLHEVLRMIDKTAGIDPSYYDLLGKVQWQLSNQNVVAMNVMASHDRLRLDENDGKARSTSGDTYVWLNARSAITPRLYSQNVLSVARLSRRREGSFSTGDEIGSLNETRSSDIATFRDDTSFDLTGRQTVKAGLRARRVHASFNFLADESAQFGILHFGTPTIIHRALVASPSGNDGSVYASDRIAIRPKFVVELGARADRQSYTPDGTHLSPRINAGWAMTPSTSVRAAWGRFVQPQGVEELQVEDGLTNYFPAQVAIHTVLGIDHRFAGGWTMRAEGYEKRLSHVRPRFENLLDSLTLFPEIRPDRFQVSPSRGVARGAELLLRKESEGPWSGWMSFSRASVRDEIDGRMVPRSWDQKNALSFSVNYGRAARWNINVAGVLHSGWPTTSLTGFVVRTSPTSGELHLVPGPLNDDRFEAYSRIDLRASRMVRAGRGSLNFFIEAMNLLNHANVSRVDHFDISVAGNGTVTAVRRTESIVPLIPSFGVTWEF